MPFPLASIAPSPSSWTAAIRRRLSRPPAPRSDGPTSKWIWSRCGRSRRKTSRNICKPRRRLRSWARPRILPWTRSHGPADLRLRLDEHPFEVAGRADDAVARVDVHDLAGDAAGVGGEQEAR